MTLLGFVTDGTQQHIVVNPSQIAYVCDTRSPGSFGVEIHFGGGSHVTVLADYDEVIAELEAALT
jgi:transcriptional regulator CtsR